MISAEDDSFSAWRREHASDLEPTADDDSVTLIGDDALDRTIVGNVAKDSAIQVLGPVGGDLWEDTRVKIENNVATDNALQLAYPISLEAFRYMMDHHAS